MPLFTVNYLTILPSFCFAAQFAQCILLHNYNSCHKAAKRENDAEDEEIDGENGQSAKLVMTFKKANTGNGHYLDVLVWLSVIGYVSIGVCVFKAGLLQMGN